MGYRRYGNPRYWSRPYYNRRPYDPSRSRYHYVFGFNTGEAATIVREIFFSLSGDALDHVLDEYGKQYGKGAKAYAKSTIYKWETGEVNMSNALVGRLLDFLPPLMTPDQKNRVVEAIWKAHAKRSMKYAYIGPDTNVEAFCEALGSYLNGLDVTHAIPGDIERCFSWLADDDAIAKQELLNHFMEKQLDAAFAAARYYVGLIVERISADAEGQISRFDHTIVVGNHQVVIKADKRRSGFIFSNSANDFYRLPFTLSGKWWLAGAAVVIGFLFLTNYGGHDSQATTTQQLQTQTQTQEQQAYQPQQYAAAPSSEPSQPVRVAEQPTFAPVISSTRRVATAPTAVPITHILAPASAPHQQSPTIVNGCATYSIASVNGDGSSVVLSNGAQYSVSDILMRASASMWSTGDEVVACTSGQNVSLKRNFQTVQAAFAGHAAVQNFGCRSLYLGYTGDEGATVVTTDGTSMTLVDNPLARASASQWSTGESVDVCAASQGAVAYVGIKRNFQEVEATVDRSGSGQARPATCSQSSVADAIDGDGVIRIGHGSYRINEALMKAEANQMAIGDPVVLCLYLSNGSTYASIARSDFQRIQAYKVP